MANNDWKDVEDEWVDVPEGGAQGGTGSDKPGSSKQFVEPERHPAGSPIDAAKSFADTAMLGAGPQIEGVMAMMAQDAKNLMAGEPLHPKVTPLDAYRDVRNAGEAEHKKSDETWWGRAGQMLGMLATPVPAKKLPKGAGVWEHAKQGVKIGAPIGAIHGAVNSDADLTSDEGGWRKYAELLKDTTVGGLGGGVTGGAMGGLLGAIEKPARSTARKLPMDMLGVSEPARRSMQRQGIYDEAGDELLKLVRPLRSGMTKASLTEDAIAELQKRGMSLDDAIAAIDAAAPEGAVTTGGMADAMRARAKPFEAGNLQDKQVASRMNKEASNLLDTIGSTDPEIGARIPLAEAESFKQRFGPGVAKLLRHAGEPAAKTTALGEAYRALKGANEAAAADVSPTLAAKLKAAKRGYSQLAAPLEGANIERAGMKGSDFDLGALLSDGPAPGSVLSKLGELPGAGLVKVPLDLAGRAYGRGAAANLAEFLANRAALNSGGGVGGQLGDVGASMAVDKLAPWSRFLGPDDEEPKP